MILDAPQWSNLDFVFSHISSFSCDLRAGVWISVTPQQELRQALLMAWRTLKKVLMPPGGFRSLANDYVRTYDLMVFPKDARLQKRDNHFKEERRRNNWKLSLKWWFSMIHNLWTSGSSKGYTATIGTCRGANWLWRAGRNHFWSLPFPLKQTTAVCVCVSDSLIPDSQLYTISISILQPCFQLGIKNSQCQYHMNPTFFCFFHFFQRCFILHSLFETLWPLWFAEGKFLPRAPAFYARPLRRIGRPESSKRKRRCFGTALLFDFIFFAFQNIFLFDQLRWGGYRLVSWAKSQDASKWWHTPQF